MRRLTRTAWFGPKRYLGWGWRIASWQGWVVTGVALGLVLDARRLWPSVALPMIVVVLVLYLAVVVLTGDPPGGPRRGE
jgi:hypothetical protein